MDIGQVFASHRGESPDRRQRILKRSRRQTSTRDMLLFSIVRLWIPLLTLFSILWKNSQDKRSLRR